MAIYLYGQPMLMQTEYLKVEDSEEAVAVGEKMAKAILRFDCSGISAPQIGHPVTMIMMKLGTGECLGIVNPVISRMYGIEKVSTESCISCPPRGNQCPVLRIGNLEVEGYTVDDLGRRKKFDFEGADAWNAQHQIDHLSGIFFFERADMRYRKRVVARFNQWKAKTILRKEAVVYASRQEEDSRPQSFGGRGLDM